MPDTTILEEQGGPPAAAGVAPPEQSGKADVQPDQQVVAPTVQRQMPNTWTARDLIKLAKQTPPVPIIKGLLNAGDILLLHGTEESFKSVMVVQWAEAIATGTPVLRVWPVAGKRRVGIIETEMHAAMMGERLTKMFPDGEAPEHIYFMNEALLKQWRREDISGKFRIMEDWIDEAEIEVLIIDTANDFFRGEDSPSEERVVGEFFDKLRSLELDGRIIVRHDRKRREVDDSSHSNELIRGSSEWKEDPEAIVHLKRMDRRTHEVQMEVGKLRYGAKPEPCKLWFDAGCFRLVPLPPVVAALESGTKTRQEIVAECKRFGLSERAVDDQIHEFRSCFHVGQTGHEKTFAIDPDKCRDAEWFKCLTRAHTGSPKD